jgi:hypothetical protein
MISCDRESCPLRRAPRCQCDRKACVFEDGPKPQEDLDKACIHYDVCPSATCKGCTLATGERE